MGIVRAVGTTGAVFLMVTVALAVGDIPTRYSGSFPSTANITGVTGTFTGTRLVLKGRGRRGTPLTGRYACTSTSSTETRCDGVLRADVGQYSDNHTVVIRWAGGRPVAMVGYH